jgi:hypothetical protein
VAKQEQLGFLGGRAPRRSASHPITLQNIK